jgi:hypothetical protein
MARLTAVEVADYWIGAGGPKARAVEWVAIAIGESSLDDHVVSPAGAIGLWQIMPFNAAPHGFTVNELYQPGVNAKVAVEMSGGGTNCAAWDSAYRNIYASGRYAFLAWPEAGSADYNNLPIAQAELSGHGLSGITNPGNPGIDNSLAASAARWQAIASQNVPAVSNLIVGRTRLIASVGRRGWRP